MEAFNTPGFLETVVASLTTTGEHQRIDELVSEASRIRQDIDDATVHCTSLENSMTGLQSERERLLEQDGTPAMNAILELVKQIESLYHFTQGQLISTSAAEMSALEAIQARSPLVNTCKSQSLVVFDHFRSLNDKAEELMHRFTELLTDLTYEVASAETRADKLRTLEKIAEALMKGIENEREVLKDRKKMEEVQVEQGRAMIRSVEEKRESMETARIVRNIFTLGIGEAFDLFDLEKDIRDAEAAIGLAEQNLSACSQSVQHAELALQLIEEEILSLSALGSTVREQEGMLQESVKHCAGLRARVIDLTNISMDVSLFIGKLCAQSETFSIDHTAQEFAQGVLRFGKTMMSEQKFSGLLLQRDPRALEETLNMISQSTDEVEGRALEGVM